MQIRFFIKITVVFIAVLMCAYAGDIHAQTRKTVTKPSPKDGKQADTVILYEKTDEQQAPKSYATPLSQMKEEVIVIKLNDSVKKEKPQYKDTVIVLKKGKSKEELAREAAKKEVQVLRNTKMCDCVKMDIDVPSVLQYETYLTYSFIFKNNCKTDVWVSSKHFKYSPLNAFGKPVKVKRKLAFVQRYDFPDFVKIMPGESYTFTFSDDVFFEYDMNKGQAYKIIFTHSNFSTKSKMAPKKTYLCGERRVQMVEVR